MTLLDELRENFNEDNIYKILRIPSDADQATIRRAYLNSSLHNHPDRRIDSPQSNVYKQKFQTLTKIYSILSDPQARLDYDKQLELRTLTREEILDCDEVKLDECDKFGDGYAHNCRCSGKFVLSSDQVAQMHDTEAFIVNCDSCSCLIRINVK